jgi:uncharacterized protein
MFLSKLQNVKAMEYSMKRILFSIVFIFLIPAIFSEADISDKNAQLIQAAEKGNLQDVLTALTNGADVNVKNIKNVTVLMIASTNGSTDVVKLLLDKGANLNAKATINNVDYTALKIAKMKGKKKIVEILERAGAKE